MTITLFLFLETSNDVNANTLESIIQQTKLLGESPQITVGKNPSDIQVNQDTGKIYVANKDSGDSHCN